MQKPGDPKLMMPEQREPMPDELFCWMDRDRVCGADCVMFETSSPNCIAVKALQQGASALTVIARTLQTGSRPTVPAVKS